MPDGDRSYDLEIVTPQKVIGLTTDRLDGTRHIVMDVFTRHGKSRLLDETVFIDKANAEKLRDYFTARTR